MASVLVAMAFTPSHRAELWTSAISIAVALLAYLLLRRPRAAVSPAASPVTSRH
jgi:hypothetical protein